MVAFGLQRCSGGCLVTLACRVQWNHGGIVQRRAWRCAFVDGMVFGGCGGMVSGGIWTRRS